MVSLVPRAPLGILLVSRDNAAVRCANRSTVHSISIIPTSRRLWKWSERSNGRHTQQQQRDRDDVGRGWGGGWSIGWRPASWHVHLGCTVPTSCNDHSKLQQWHRRCLQLNTCLGWAYLGNPQTEASILNNLALAITWRPSWIRLCMVPWSQQLEMILSSSGTQVKQHIRSVRAPC